MADNRADIAIETAEAINRLIVAEIERADASAEKSGLARATSVIATFIEAVRVQQAPRRGRPRNPKAEA